MVILIFFKMAATAILDFQNFNFSTARTVKRVELHHSANFCRNRFNRGRDIAIFRYFMMAADAILDFRNLKFLTLVTVKRVELHHSANFRRNRSNRGAEICEFQYYASLPIHVPFWVFWGTFSPNDITHRPKPQKDHPWAEPRHLSHKPRTNSY